MVILHVTVANGYHIQANPASNEFLVPMELQFEHVDGIEVGPGEYPQGIGHRLEGTTENLMTYAGTVSVRIPITTSVTASDGVRLIRGALRYQACDSGRCFSPTSAPVAFKVVVAI